MSWPCDWVHAGFGVAAAMLPSALGAAIAVLFTAYELKRDKTGDSRAKALGEFATGFVVGAALLNG
jgi:hypothetical protein